MKKSGRAAHEATSFNDALVENYSVPPFADINGDGRLDLVLDNEEAPLELFAGNANGTFRQATGIASPLSGITVASGYASPSPSASAATPAST